MVGSEAQQTGLNTGTQPSQLLVDSFGRVARKLRIQVTDRCNFRCDFCMPPDPVWLDHSELLTFEELTRLTTILAHLGVERIRLSGGEPLVRRHVERLVGMLTRVSGIKTVSLTTNGSLLKEKARLLKENGLTGVTVSLHSLRADRYAEITGTNGMLQRALEGIQEAVSAGFDPVKVNCVVRRGNNEDEVLDFAKLAHERGLSLRFIEYMPFDGKRFWDVGRVMGGAEIIQKIGEVYKLVSEPRKPGSTARTYKFADGSRGEVSTITSMTEPFCGDCDRIRLTADGMMVPCLFSTNEYDVRSLLRRGAEDPEVASYIRKCFWLKSEGVESMLKRHAEFGRIRPMHTIGG